MHKTYADMAKIPKKYEYTDIAKINEYDDILSSTSKDECEKNVNVDRNFIASRVEFISFNDDIIKMKCVRTKEEKVFNAYYRKFHNTDKRIDKILRNLLYSLEDENEIKLFVENLFYVYYNTYTVYVQCSVKKNIVNNKERILNGEFNFKYNFTTMVNMLKKKLSNLECKYNETYDFKELCDISNKILLIKNELEWIANETVCDFENELMDDLPFSKLSLLDSL